jgi:hypothetical protein
MTNATDPTTLPQLRAVSVSLHGRIAEVDGCRVECRTIYSPGDLYGGRPDWEVETIGAPVLADRAEWDACHPGVEPTAAAMAAVIEDAAYDLSEIATEEAQRPADDFDDYGDDVEVLS